MPLDTSAKNMAWTALRGSFDQTMTAAFRDDRQKVGRLGRCSLSSSITPSPARVARSIRHEPWCSFGAEPLKEEVVDSLAT